MTDPIAGSKGTNPDAVRGPASLVSLPSMWIHGAGLSGATWDGMTASLPLAVTPDLPGHGGAPLLGSPSVEGYADALEPHLPAGAILIGHSLGGMVALELARRAPQPTRALVLIESVPTVRDTWAGRMSATLAAGVFSAMPPRWMGWLSGLGQGAATQAEFEREFAQRSKVQIAAALEASLRYDGRFALATIAIPTLVVVGRNNSATHRGARLAAHGIAHARFLTLPGGHMLHTDNPTQLRRTIDDFLRKALNPSDRTP